MEFKASMALKKIGLEKGHKQYLMPLLPAVIMLGIVSQVAQVLFLRELLMVFQGNELSIGFIFAAWLLWVGVGSRLGSYMVKFYKQPLLLLALNSLAIIAALPLTLLLARLLRGILGLPGAAIFSHLDMFFASFMILLIPCLLIGIQFVLLAKIWMLLSYDRDISGIGSTYVGEAVGNMLGGILFTFILVRYFNAFQAALIVNFFMLAAFLLLLVHRGKKAEGKQTAGITAGLAVLMIIAFFSLDNLDRWAYQMQWQFYAPNHSLIDTYQSKYGTIAVLQLEEQYSFFQSGHLLFSTAGPGEKVPSLEEQEALEFAHFAMLQHECPEKVLLIGGGLRGILSAVLKHPVKEVDYVELDEVLTTIAEPFISLSSLDAISDPRVTLVHADARLYIKKEAGNYDLIIVDIPDPATAVLNRYYTAEFFRESSMLLNPGGILVCGAVSTPDLRGRAIANRNSTIYHSLNSAFPLVLVAGSHFLYYIAGSNDSSITVDPHKLHGRYRGRELDEEHFSSYHFYTLLEESQLKRANWVVRMHGRSSESALEGPAAVPLILPGLEEILAAEKEAAPVNQKHFINSDFKPIGYFYTLTYHEELVAGFKAINLSRLLEIDTIWIIPFITAAFLALTFFRYSDRKTGKATAINYAVLLAVFTTGLSTMALQVALIFSFQSIYGFVFEMVGLIVALFMCGLALGAFLINRYVALKDNISMLAMVQLSIALVAVLIALSIPQTALIEYHSLIFLVFAAFTFAAGLINGIDFPLTTACYYKLTGEQDKTAGVIYGLELTGACLGAVLAGAVLIPVLGIATAGWLAALANGTAFIVLLLCGRSGRL